MKKIFPVIFLIFYLITHSYAQNKILIPFRSGKLWGYSTIDKKIVIQCKYSFAYMFRNGFARVQQNKNWGVIDSTGNIVIPIKFSKLIHVNNNIFIGESNNKIYFLNTLGIEKFLCTKTKRFGVEYLKENIFSLKCDDISMLLDSAGNLLLSGNDIFFSTFNNGYLFIKENTGFGYFIDKNGKRLSTPLNLKCHDGFKNGMAVVTIKDNSVSKYGFIDSTGQNTIPCIYDYAIAYRNGLSLVKKEKKWGFINKENQVVVPIIYDGCQFETNGSFYITTIDNKQGIVDTLGQIVIPPKYEKIYKYFYNNGNIIIGRNNKYGLVDSAGNEILPVIYDRIYGTDNILYVNLDKKAGLINGRGNVLIPIEYDLVTSNNSEYNRNVVCKNNKWGYVSNSSKLLIPCEYYEAKSFYKNSAWVRLNGYNLIDTMGNPISEKKYDHVWEYQIDNIESSYRIALYKEIEGLTLTEKYTKKYFVRKLKHPICSDERYLFRFDFVKKVLEINGFVGRTGIEYFEDKE